VDKLCALRNIRQEDTNFLNCLKILGDLLRFDKGAESILKLNKAQQSLTQSIGQLNRAWFKAWNPFFHGLSPLDTLCQICYDLA
jgi:hypothetical protein